MDSRIERRIAFALIAAIAGTGFASGQELALFFAQFGKMAWLGVAVAAVVFGLLMSGMICCVRKFGASSFSETFYRQTGKFWGNIANALHSFLTAMVLMIMLDRTGRIGALTLPTKYGFPLGIAIALMLSIVINAYNMRGACRLGMGITILAALFYGGLALDNRHIRSYIFVETDLLFEGAVDKAILFALFYATMNGAVAAGVLPVLNCCGAKPARVGFYSGALLAALLIIGNMALLRGGKVLYAAKLPMVILAVRWGKFGFWLSAAFMYICSAATFAVVIRKTFDGFFYGFQERYVTVLTLAAAFFICTLLKNG